MSESEYIGLAWITSYDEYDEPDPQRLCEFPRRYRLMVAKGMKVIYKESEEAKYEMIGRIRECCTVAKDSAEYRMITHRFKVSAKIVGTVNEFENEEGGE